MKTVKLIKEYEADRLYKVGEELKEEDSKADNLVSVGLAEYVKEAKKEKPVNE